MIYGDEWSQKYYDLIAGIIANRMKVEQYSLNYLVSEFNQLFNKNISNGIGNPFAEIQVQFGGKANVEYKWHCDGGVSQALWIPLTFSIGEA